MKKTFAVAMLAIALGACSESPMAPDAQFASKGVSNPFSDVGATASIVTVGTGAVTLVPGSERTTACNADLTICTGLPKNLGNTIGNGALGNEICVAGHYYKPASPYDVYITRFGRIWEHRGSYTMPHAQCADFTTDVGSTITITFGSYPANYVLSTNSNIQLNFKDITAFLHYQSNKNAVSGEGILLGAGSDGSVWEINLGAYNHAGTSGMEQGVQSVALTTNEVGGALRTNVAATLTWVAAKAQ